MSLPQTAILNRREIDGIPDHPYAFWARSERTAPTLTVKFRIELKIIEF